jgi:hypothetical protein
MPVTKLFGQAPGGLSTDDASAMRNWSARVGSYQRHALTPATNKLLKTILLSTQGPTRGVEPESWMVKWAPYEIPSEAEEAATLKTKSEALAILVANGAISPDEMRNSIKGMAVELDAEEALVTPLVADAESYTPPQGVQDNAKRALEVRETKPESERGMTEVGIARARDLSNGRPVSLETIKRMSSYFERHEVDKQGESWESQGKGWQAWMGWGGDEGRTWVNSILDGLDD